MWTPIIAVLIMMAEATGEEPPEKKFGDPSRTFWPFDKAAYYGTHSRPAAGYIPPPNSPLYRPPPRPLLYLHANEEAIKRFNQYQSSLAASATPPSRNTPFNPLNLFNIIPGFQRKEVTNPPHPQFAPNPNHYPNVIPPQNNYNLVQPVQPPQKPQYQHVQPPQKPQYQPVQPQQQKPQYQPFQPQQKPHYVQNPQPSNYYPNTAVTSNAIPQLLPEVGHFGPSKIPHEQPPSFPKAGLPNVVGQQGPSHNLPHPGVANNFIPNNTIPQELMTRPSPSPNVVGQQGPSQNLPPPGSIANNFIPNPAVPQEFVTRPSAIEVLQPITSLPQTLIRFPPPGVAKIIVPPLQETIPRISSIPTPQQMVPGGFTELVQQESNSQQISEQFEHEDSTLETDIDDDPNEPPLIELNQVPFHQSVFSDHIPVFETGHRVDSNRTVEVLSIPPPFDKLSDIVPRPRDSIFYQNVPVGNKVQPSSSFSVDDLNVPDLKGFESVINEELIDAGTTTQRDRALIHSNQEEDSIIHDLHQMHQVESNPITQNVLKSNNEYTESLIEKLTKELFEPTSSNPIIDNDLKSPNTEYSENSSDRFIESFSSNPLIDLNSSKIEYSVIPTERLIESFSSNPIIEKDLNLPKPEYSENPIEVPTSNPITEEESKSNIEYADSLSNKPTERLVEFTSTNPITESSVLKFEFSETSLSEKTTTEKLIEVTTTSSNTIAVTKPDLIIRRYPNLIRHRFTRPIVYRRRRRTTTPNTQQI